MSFRIFRWDTEIRFETQFGENRTLQNCPKFVWSTTPKKLALRGSRPSPILPKIVRSRRKLPERCHRLTCPPSTYTEFGPDQLRFAGLIPERLIFRPKKLFIGFQYTVMHSNIRHALFTAQRSKHSNLVKIQTYVRCSTFNIMLNCQEVSARSIFTRSGYNSRAGTVLGLSDVALSVRGSVRQNPTAVGVLLQSWYVAGPWQLNEWIFIWGKN